MNPELDVPTDKARIQKRTAGPREMMKTASVLGFRIYRFRV